MDGAAWPGHMAAHLQATRPACSNLSGGAEWTPCESPHPRLGLGSGANTPDPRPMRPAYPSIDDVRRAKAVARVVTATAVSSCAAACRGACGAVAFGRPQRPPLRSPHGHSRSRSPVRVRALPLTTKAHLCSLRAPSTCPLGRQLKGSIADEFTHLDQIAMCTSTGSHLLKSERDDKARRSSQSSDGGGEKPASRSQQLHRAYVRVPKRAQHPIYYNDSEHRACQKSHTNRTCQSCSCCILAPSCSCQ